MFDLIPRQLRKGLIAYTRIIYILTLTLLMPAIAQAILIGEYSIYPAYTQSGIDSGLAADKDGNIWFTENYRDSIGRITPAGEVTVFPLSSDGHLTGGITAGPDGNIWVTKEFSSGILRITPTGMVTEFPVSMESPRSITAGPDGNLWFTGRQMIGRISPEGRISYFPRPDPISLPMDIITGPDGNLWFVEIGPHKIARITLDGIITEFQELTSAPLSITSGPDGNLWFTMGNKIGRITLDGVVTEFAIPTPESFCYGIASGPDGNIWFAVNNRDRIGRITTNGVFLPELATPSGISAPQHITASPDGLIWFTESNTNKIGIVSLDTFSSFFPLASGTSWTYKKNGIDGYTRTVSSGTFSINNLPTKRIEFSDAYEVYMTNDENGIREHAENDLTSPITTATFSPPLIYANAQSMLGRSVYSSGTVSMVQEGIPLSFGYYGDSTIQNIETIIVPAGTFRTFKIATSLNVAGFMASQTIWVADKVGIVKEISDGETYLLSGTNINDTTPDPFWLNAQFAVAPGLVVTSNTFTVSGITASTSTPGTMVTLTATSDSGSTFAGWSGGGCSGTGNCTVTMNAAQTVTATFSLNKYTLTVAKSSSSDGTITSIPAAIECGTACSSDYYYGTQVALMAATTGRSIITNWTDCDNGNGNLCLVTIKSAVNVTATFSLESDFTILRGSYDPGSGFITLSWSSESGQTYDLQYSDDPYGDNMAWTLLEGAIPTGNEGFTTYTDNGSKTGTPPGYSTVSQRYYRVAVTGTEPAQFSRDWWGVFSTQLVEGMNLVSLPLIPESALIGSSVGSQLTGAISPSNADRVWFWDKFNKSYAYAWLSTNVNFPGWRSTAQSAPLSILSLDPDKGFWVQIKSGHGPQILKISGRVANANQGSDMVTGMQLFGSPYPVEVSLADANLNAHGALSPSNADRIWYWDRANQKYAYAWLSTNASFPGWRSTSQGTPPPAFTLQPGYGYWLQVRDQNQGFTWIYTKPYSR